MTVGTLAYLLVVSAFCATIFIVSMPLLARSERGLPTKIYLAEISVAALTALITFIYIAINTGNFFFHNQNLYIKLLCLISLIC